MILQLLESKLTKSENVYYTVQKPAKTAKYFSTNPMNFAVVNPSYIRTPQPTCTS